MPESSADRLHAGVKPILKWAGGKRQLLSKLRPFYPAAFGSYFEPFVGSGAVFLDLHNRGALAGRPVHLSDINADVIGCYRAVRDDVDEVIRSLRALEVAHAAGGANHFSKVRDRQFNPTRERLRSAKQPAAYTPDLAAMLIYLNRTGYNGLFRVNARGAFNVPAGRYVRPRICDEESLRLVSGALRRPGLTLEVLPFADAMGAVQAGDFIYLDPPYVPLSATARFTAYSAGGFGPVEQERLQQAVLELASRKAFVLLSNSAAPDIERLYTRNPRALDAGLQASRVPARRAINSRATRRGPISEYLITNVPRASDRQSLS